MTEKNLRKIIAIRQVCRYNDGMAEILEQIRRMIEASGKTRYRIAKESGIAQSQLSRLMSGERGLSVETLQTLANYLQLEIVIRPKRRRKDG